MVPPAEQHEVVQARLAAPRPVANVMGIDEEAVLTAWEAAAVVAPLQRPPHRRRDRTGLPADRERLPLPLTHPHDRRVAGEPPRRLARDRRPLVELAASRRPAGKDAFVDVHDHLLPLPARA